jgi:hypothetical protein
MLILLKGLCFVARRHLEHRKRHGMGLAMHFVIEFAELSIPFSENSFQTTPEYDFLNRHRGVHDDVDL